MVATPGCIIDMLEKRKINFDSYKYFCMDEADRMVDLGFKGDVQNIMSFFKVTNSALVLLQLQPTHFQLNSDSQ